MESYEEIETKLSLYGSQLEQYYPNQVSTSSSNSLNLRKRGRENSDDDEDNEPNPANDKADDQYNLSDLEEVDGEEEERPAGTVSVLLSPKTDPLKAGDHVEVIGGDRTFAAVITEAINAKEFKIKYYEYAEEVSLPLTSLRRMTPGPYVQQHDQIHNDHLTVGSRCQSKYATDQQYYDATITEKTKHGYIVTYTGYGNSEEVPLEYLKPPVMTLGKVQDVSDPTGGVGIGGGVGGQKSGNGKVHGNDKSSGEKKSQLIPIPANLQILPTDTEEEKARKKKKIKAIKNKNRIISQEEDVKQVQQSWKKFVDKGSKKALSGIVKSSQFASSEANQSKVGVTNSGKGMTTYAERKKYKFDPDA